MSDADKIAFADKILALLSSDQRESLFDLIKDDDDDDDDLVILNDLPNDDERSSSSNHLNDSVEFIGPDSESTSSTPKDFPDNVSEWYGIVPHNCRKLRCRRGKCQLQSKGEIANNFYIIITKFDVWKAIGTALVTKLTDENVAEFNFDQINIAVKRIVNIVVSIIVGKNCERVDRLADKGLLRDFCNSIAEKFEALNSRYQEIYRNKPFDKTMHPTLGLMLNEKMKKRFENVRHDWRKAQKQQEEQQLN